MVIPSADTKSTTAIATTTTVTTITNNIQHSNAAAATTATAATTTSATRSATITAAITLKAQHKQSQQIPVVAGQQPQLQNTITTTSAVANTTQIQPPPRQHPKKRKFDPAELDQHSGEAHQHNQQQQQQGTEAGDILPAKNSALAVIATTSTLSTLKNCNITLYHNSPTTASTSNAHTFISTLPVLNTKSVPPASTPAATYSHYATTTKTSLEAPNTLFTIRTIQPIVVSSIANTTGHIAKSISSTCSVNNEKINRIIPVHCEQTPYNSNTSAIVADNNESYQQPTTTTTTRNCDIFLDLSEWTNTRILAKISNYYAPGIIRQAITSSNEAEAIKNSILVEFDSQENGTLLYTDVLNSGRYNVILDACPSAADVVLNTRVCVRTQIEGRTDYVFMEGIVVDSNQTTKQFIVQLNASDGEAQIVSTK